MTQPDDRELEQYLEGGSKLSRRYRDASGEGAPPELDEAILAQARAELRRKPNLNRWMASMALAASLVLGVNLAWNIYQSEPMPGGDSVTLAGKSARDDFVPEPSPPASAAPLATPERAPQPQAKARAPAEVPAPEALRERDAAPAAREEEKREDVAQTEQRAAMAPEQAAESQRRKMTASDNAAGASAYAAPAPATAPMAALADAAPMSENARIDHLIDHVRTLEGAVFVRNGKEYGPAEAAKDLQLKREKAGSRVKTADDFIRLCASHSSMSGDAYLIRLEDGRTRTAEDVLREELSRMEAR